MASSVQRVEAALRADEQRVLRRQATAAESAIVRGALPFEWDEDKADGGSKTSHSDISVSAKLQRVVNRMVAVNRLGQQPGVKHSYLSSWSNLARFKGVTSDNHQLFIGSVLGSPQLMAQSARSMQSLHSFFFPPEAEAASGAPQQLNRSALLHEIAKVVHEVKVSTAHTCWFDVVQSLQDTKAEMYKNLEELKEQFHQARSSYLEELSQLRDAVRVRGDPLNERTFDVVYQFEPLNTLEDGEKKFMLSVVRELMKMMVETNPKVVKTFDFGQVERLMSQVESKEVTDLRALVKKQKLEIDQMQSVIQQMEAAEVKKRYDSGAISAETGPSSASYEQMITLLEEQLQDLRRQLWELQTEAKKTSAELEVTKDEREELAYGLQEEENQKVLLQEEVDHMKESCSKLETSKRELETKLDKLKDDLKQSERNVKRLRKIADRRKKSDEATDADYLEEHMGAELTEKLSEMEQERDSAAKDLDKLEKRVGELQALLSEHAAQSFRRSAEEAVDDVDDLVDYADNLLCPGLKTYSKKVRACRCGNVLVEDAIFCRKCGTEWHEEDYSQQDSVDVIDLAATVSTLEDQLKEAEATLSAGAREFEGYSTPHGASVKVHADTSSRDTGAVETEPGNHSADASGGNISDGKTQRKSSVKLPEGRRAVQLDTSDDQGTSTVVASSTVMITQEERKMQWHIERMGLQMRIDELQRQKLQAEARLLVKRATAAYKGAGVYNDGFQQHEGAETSSHLCDKENCPYAQELASVRLSLKAVRGLCSQMGKKLKLVAGENLQLSEALQSAQNSLESASQVVGSHSEGSEILTSIKQSLDESKRQSVFWRLYHNNGSTTRIKRRLEQEAELTRKTYEQIYWVEHREGQLTSGLRASDSPLNEGDRDDQAMEAQISEAVVIKALTPPSPRGGRTTPMRSARGNSLQIAPQGTEKESPMLAVHSTTLPQLSDSQSGRRPSNIRRPVSRHAADATGGGDHDRRSRDMHGVVLTGDALTKPGTAKRHSLPR
eukprot:TRINITY_DN12581_c0_g1_i2.p1 TRINITY_DN12581_c0_g1~~TRINITY_DN12581_c0_g1_i2.p1  ORF type:complete len:1010 (+),score=222.01 TRINITY_DN12581_c0_g1_i2:63-3092(+)